MRDLTILCRKDGLKVFFLKPHRNDPKEKKYSLRLTSAGKKRFFGMWSIMAVYFSKFISPYNFSVIGILDR